MAGCREKRRGDLQATLLGQIETRSRGADMAARTAGELAACRRIAIDRRGDLVEADAEDVVKQKGGALQRRQALQRQHQRQRHVVDLVLRRLDHRLRQPWPDIGLTPMPRRFQLIEAKPGHDAAQIGFRLTHRGAVGIEPAQKRFLDNVLGVRDRTHHPVGDANEFRAQRIETCGRVSATLSSSRHLPLVDGMHRAKPTCTRFQPLIATINSVSVTCSSSLN